MTAEVINIDRHGIWILVEDREYFLSHTDFPWFKNATVSQVLNVELIRKDHLYWPDLDVDLSVDSIRNTEQFPLIYE